MEHLSQILQKAKSDYQAIVSLSFKELLETKHLYQNIKIDINTLYVGLKKACSAYGMDGELVLNNFEAYTSYPLGTSIGRKLFPSFNVSSQTDIAPIRLPTIKIYCASCKRIEPFNPLVAGEFFETQRSIEYPIDSKHASCQMFILEYQCQSCKEIPNVFLIRKDCNRISLHGRSPIEVCPVPKVIPKNFSNYFSDSIIAYNSGQVLAALFLIRTFIEQFTREETKSGTSVYADEVLSSYMEGLPQDFKQRFPSLKNIYGNLSVSIHKGDPNEDTYIKSRQEIVEHFEARTLFKLN